MSEIIDVENNRNLIKIHVLFNLEYLVVKIIHH